MTSSKQRETNGEGRHRAGTPPRARSRRSVQVGAVAAGTALLLAACGSSGSATTGTKTGKGGGTGSSYKVAIISEETGLDGAVGTAYAQGIEAYFSSVNKAGGIDGHMIDYGTPFDGQSTESGDATAIRGALAEKPDAIVGLVGFLQSSTNLLKSAAIPVIAAQLPDPSWALVKPFPWYFNPVGDFVEPYVDGFKRFLGGSLAGKKIDFITLNLPTEVQEIKADEVGIKAQGGSSPVTEVVDPTQLSFASEAAAIAADHPAGVGMELIGPGTKQMTQDLANDGFHGPIINFAPGADPTTIASVGLPNFYGERFWKLPSPSGPIEKAASAAGIKLSAQSDPGQGWVNGVIAVTGLRACQPTSCSSSAVEHALESAPINAPGVMFGPLTYTPTNHLGNMTYGYYHYDPTTKSVVLAGAPLAVNSNDVAQDYGLKG